MQRTIFHVDMDAFFVSVEELRDPSLKGKPVVVGGKANERGVVSAASYAARKFGVHSAMPLRTAYKLCPQAIFLDGHPERYREASLKVRAVLESFSPQVEMASIDEAYLDMTGTERLHGPPLRSAHLLHEKVKRETELNCSIGIGTSRLVAKISSDQGKPNGICYVLAGCEQAFLAPLEVRKIPGVGKVSEKNLHDLGIKTVGDLAKLDDDFLEEKFGKWGLAMAGKSRGEDAGGYFEAGVSYSEDEGDPKSISHEHTFSEDTRDAELLESTLARLSEMVARRLRDGGLRARNVSLKLRTSDFATITRAQTLEEPTQLDPKIFSIIQHLFRENWEPARGKFPTIRLLGVKAADLQPASDREAEDEAQLSLLPAESSTPKPSSGWENALSAADKLREKYGDSAVSLARGMKGSFRERTHEALIVDPKKKPQE
ncbi:MAG: DNA polymerase IV [Terriglobales bacterium]